MPEPPSSITILTLLRLRDEGRCRDARFARAIRYGVQQPHGGGGSSSREQYWSLSKSQRIHPPVTDNYRRSSRPWTTAMDLSSDGGRFLLTGGSSGTVCVYDFGDQDSHLLQQRSNDVPNNNNNNNNSGTAPHFYRPLQQAETTTSSLSAVQWYHDAGIFLTASTNGTVVLWDTEAMSAVLEVQPFQYDHYSRLQNNTASAQTSHQNSCHCLKLSPTSMLAATGSHYSHLVKLVDFRSGTSSHTLTHNNKEGVTAVQWWPHNEHVVASCAGTVNLWDIRRSRLPLAVLDEEIRAHQLNDHGECLVSTAVQKDGAHWGAASPQRVQQQQRKQSVASTKFASANGSFTNNNKNIHTTATNLAFAGPHHLVTVCGKRRTIQVWDLRYSPSPMVLPHRYVDLHHGKPLDSSTGSNLEPQPLAVTGHCHRDRILWVTRDHALHGYRLYDNAPGSTPDVVLRGHWGRIHVVASSSSEEHNNDDAKLVTASPTDRLMLVWKRQKQVHHRPHKASVPGTEATQSRKRRVDQDSW
jgi:WD40 repeat protein